MKDLLFGLFLLTAAPPAISQAEGMAPEASCFRIERLFDPAQPAAVVDEEMTRLRTAADQGGSHAAYLLGVFYRLGPAHPAARLPHDPDAARRWLGKAAFEGNLTAMAGLAENELAAGRAMEAMVLAQAIVHYSAKHPDVPLAGARKYQAGLVARAFEALGREASATHDAEILAAFRQFVAQNGEGIEAGIKKSESGTKASNCPSFPDADRWPVQYQGRSHVMAPAKSRKQATTPVYAVFLLVIGANGRVAEALVVDSLPGPEAGIALRPLAEDMRFNRIRGAPPRAALAPLTL